MPTELTADAEVAIRKHLAFGSEVAPYSSVSPIEHRAVAVDPGFGMRQKLYINK